MPKKFRNIFLISFLLFLFLFSGDLVSLYVDALWFSEIHQEGVFSKSLLTETGLGAGLGLVFFVFFLFNLLMADRFRALRSWGTWEAQMPLPLLHVLKTRSRTILLFLALAGALISGLQGAGEWRNFLLFLNPVPFGKTDPLLGLDAGFYVFQLPFLIFLQKWIVGVLLVTGVFSLMFYLFKEGVRLNPQGFSIDQGPLRHLVLLGALLFLAWAWGYRLDTYDLLYSHRGVIFGAGYADVNVRLPALNFLFFLSLAASGVMVYTAFRRGTALPLATVAVVLLLQFLGANLLPEMIQKFKVTPNEIFLERPYIESNIEWTRFGYNLNNIEVREFPVAENLTRETLARNETTIKNVRLWDHSPLEVTYRQLQQIRPYYDFINVDNDRYMINGEYRQVTISPRELTYQNLLNRNWINEHLTFTHGYGVTMGPVNRISREGLPEFFIQDIPPASSIPLKITRPEIYYGEIPNEYVFIRTREKEFDYPSSGDTNVYTTYAGQGGVTLSSLGTKILFSAYFGSLKILLSNALNADSRILFFRNIKERVSRLVPFLSLDQDAYMVVTDSGHLVWMLDGYTTSAMLPYSLPAARSGNYIRNSVKITVDAYDGTVLLYISDPDDPIVRSYDRIFPGLFLPMDKMPLDLRGHIRYPVDLFNLQAAVYSTYHMKDPQIFYNKEDLFSIPRKGEKPIEPFYTIMKLPGEAKEEFVLLNSFTPSKRDNMIAWLAARSDEPHYGKLIMYHFPKQKLIYGPRQVEARIDQDAYISQQLSLWNQQGSKVIRGSLLVIPIEDSLIYVEPLYLAAEAKGSIPELRRVIVAYGNQLIMEDTLEGALQSLFGKRAVSAAGLAPSGLKPEPQRLQSQEELGKTALELYRKAQGYLKDGNWTKYGETLGQMEETLKQLSHPESKK
ncbi:MAG TPA: UPF0182 family protein [Nitrospiria bacterium]|nr:UPF0182 family protein [Nitrospiria bacterium]